MIENNLLKIKITYDIRSSKRKYYKYQFIKFKNVMQKIWPTKKSVFHSSQNKNAVKAILFNNYFAGIASELEADIPSSNLVPLIIVSNPLSSFGKRTHKCYYQT